MLSAFYGVYSAGARRADGFEGKLLLIKQAIEHVVYRFPGN
jgi:hypothetical protein